MNRKIAALLTIMLCIAFVSCTAPRADAAYDPTDGVPTECVSYVLNTAGYLQSFIDLYEDALSLQTDQTNWYRDAELRASEAVTVLNDQNAALNEKLIAKKAKIKELREIIRGLR